MSAKRVSLLALAFLFTIRANAGTWNCGGEFLQNGGWKGFWNTIGDSVQTYCYNKTPTGQSRTANYAGGMIQIETQLKPGISDNHCFQALEDILENCMDSSKHGSNSWTDGEWSSNANVDEWHWIWVSDTPWDCNNQGEQSALCN
jgi:hypothetical protein